MKYILTISHLCDISSSKAILYHIYQWSREHVDIFVTFIIVFMYLTCFEKPNYPELHYLFLYKNMFNM